MDADSEGVLSVILGSVSPIGMSFDGPCWLEAEVDGEVLTPRREVVSVPYAFRSANADSLGGLGAASFSLAGHTHDEAYINEGQDSSVTEAMILPDIVSSIDGVTNDGGDIDLVAGTNITITADDTNDRITIEATGGAAGDITAVHADDGLSGGATEGDAHLSVNTGAGLEVSHAVCLLRLGCAVVVLGVTIPIYHKLFATLRTVSHAAPPVGRTTPVSVLQPLR